MRRRDARKNNTRRALARKSSKPDILAESSSYASLEDSSIRAHFLKAVEQCIDISTIGAEICSTSAWKVEILARRTSRNQIIFTRCSLTLTFDLTCISSRRPSPSLGADTRIFSETTCKSHSQLSERKSEADDDIGSEGDRPPIVESSDVDGTMRCGRRPDSDDAVTATVDIINIAISIAIIAAVKRKPPAATTPFAGIVDVGAERRRPCDIVDRNRKCYAVSSSAESSAETALDERHPTSGIPVSHSWIVVV
jgi:hypothetical protein